MHNVTSDEATLAQFLQNELVMYVSINTQRVKISNCLARYLGFAKERLKK